MNIGDIAHTPGMLALPEKHRPGAEITLWPSSVDRVVEEILRARFPKLKIAKSKAEQESTLAACDFFCRDTTAKVAPGKLSHRNGRLD